MFLNEIMEVANYQIVEGGVSPSSFIYPKYFRYLVFKTQAGIATIYFDTKTTEIVDVHVYDLLGRGHNYRWVKKEYIETFKQHAIDNKIDHSDKCFVDFEEDILEKVVGILENRKFNEDVIIKFELDDDVIDILKQKAIDQNVTFDQFITDAIIDYIKETCPEILNHEK